MEAKQACSRAKGVITKKINDINALMSNERNVTDVNKKVSELREAFKRFQTIHETFYGCLQNKKSIMESQLYFELVSDQIGQLRENVYLWQNGIESAKQINSFQIP